MEINLTYGALMKPCCSTKVWPPNNNLPTTMATTNSQQSTMAAAIVLLAEKDLPSYEFLLLNILAFNQQCANENDNNNLLMVVPAFGITSLGSIHSIMFQQPPKWSSRMFYAASPSPLPLHFILHQEKCLWCIFCPQNVFCSSNADVGCSFDTRCSSGHRVALLENKDSSSETNKNEGQIFNKGRHAYTQIGLFASFPMV